MKDFNHKKNANRHYQDSHLTFGKLTCSVCGIKVKNLTCLKRHSKNLHGLGVKDLERIVAPNNPKIM